jgi:hypothetical protein
LSALGKPENAPDWLKAVWVNDDPMFILYEPQRIENRESSIEDRGSNR